MDIKISPLRHKDFEQARKFAIEGMHLSWYASNKLLLYFYSKYFWYLEIFKATGAWGAYMNEKLVGVLLIDFVGELKLFRSVWYKIYRKFVEFIMNLFYKKAASTYDTANKEMLLAFKKENKPDGEINFFAVNPAIKGKGIGTLLLNELEKEKKDKLIYLFTDSGSTYQFYLHRGFTESGRRDIVMEINGKEIPLTCFLFSKRL